MPIFLRLFWMLTLCFFLTGCSYRQCRLPPDTEPEAPIVQVRQHVKIVTIDGSEFTGEVAAVNPDEIALWKPGNYGYDQIVFSADEIAEIKTQKIPDLISGLLLGAALMFSVGLFLLSQVSWGYT